MASTYSTATIAADRGQRSFHLSLGQFLAKRGGSAIASRGRAPKQSNAALFASIQARYGVPPGPLIAIWGMETGFGREHGNQNTLSAVATLAYDCRRSAYFTDQLYAALTLIDRGILSASTRGSMHGDPFLSRSPGTPRASHPRRGAPNRTRQLGARSRPPRPPPRNRCGLLNQRPNESPPPRRR